MIIPNHDLVRRVSRVWAASNNCKDVGTEQQLNGANAATSGFSAEGLLEWQAVVHPKTGGSATGEAALVLVEP